VVFCGRADCRAVVDRDVLELMIDSGPPAKAPPPVQRQRSFTVRVTVSWISTPGVRGHESYGGRY
jgi:hypothetical protein